MKESLIVWLVNTSISVKPVRLNLDGLSFLKNGEIETLKADNLFDFNSIADPKLIYPSSRQVSVSSKKVSANIEPRSVNVIVLNYKKQAAFFQTFSFSEAYLSKSWLSLTP